MSNFIDLMDYNLEDDSESDNFEEMLTKCNTSTEYMNVLKSKPKLKEKTFLPDLEKQWIEEMEEIDRKYNNNFFDNFVINFCNHFPEKPKTERSIKNIFANLKDFLR